jgi:putative oxidoreductase
MWSKLSNYRDGALLFLRLALGSFFIYVHGWPKLAGGLVRWKEVGAAMKHVGLDFWPVFWGFMAAFSESIGCALIVIGFCFRPACFLLTITLTVASVMKYTTAKENALLAAAHPIELTLVFIALLFIGPGRYSIDKG